MRKLFFVLGMQLFLGHSLQAQVKTVIGKIISSSDDKPVPGATITVEGGKKGIRLQQAQTAPGR